MSKEVGDLLALLPLPIWQIDARASGRAALELRDRGVNDFESHIASNPMLVDRIFSTVTVESANAAAVKLFGANDSQQLIRPIQYFFECTPAARSRILRSRLEGHRCHIDEFTVTGFDNQSTDIVFFVSFPPFDRPEERSFAIMYDKSWDSAGNSGPGFLKASQYQHLAPIGRPSIAELIHDFAQHLFAVSLSADTARTLLRRMPPDIGKALSQTDRIAHSIEQAAQILGQIRTLTARQSQNH